MKTTKLTKKDFYKMIIELATENDRNDIVEFAQHEIDLLNNKAGRTTLTATQKENETIKDIILAELKRIGKPVTITELINNSEALNKYTNPKITALCTQLLKINLVDRIPDKKKAYYTIKEQ